MSTRSYHFIDRFLPQRRKNCEIYKFLQDQLKKNLPQQIKKLKEQESRLIKQATKVLLIMLSSYLQSYVKQQFIITLQQYYTIVPEYILLNENFPQLNVYNKEEHHSASIRTLSDDEDKVSLCSNEYVIDGSITSNGHSLKCKVRTDDIMKPIYDYYQTHCRKKMECLQVQKKYPSTGREILKL